MKKFSLSGIKNAVWALGIFASLLALLVGLVFSVSFRYQGEKEDGVLVLGQNRANASAGDDVIFSADGGFTGGALNEMQSTQDNGLEAVFSYTFLCDRTVSAISDYSSDYGSNATVQVWTDGGDGLSASNAAVTDIIYPSDGSFITPSAAAMVSQPRRLVIYLGGDGLASATQESFISGYEALIREIRNASPDTVIICCSIASVSSAYSGSDGLNAQLISQANGWIRQICMDTGAYYADLASQFNGEDGLLKDEFTSPDGRSLGSAGIAKFVEFFRFHSVS